MEGTYPARVALQELDLLEELDVVGAQAVQLALQGLDGVLRQAALLGAGGWAGGRVGRWAGPAVEGVWGEASVLAQVLLCLPGTPAWPGAMSLTCQPLLRAPCFGETPHQAEVAVLGSLSSRCLFTVLSA